MEEEIVALDVEFKEINEKSTYLLFRIRDYRIIISLFITIIMLMICFGFNSALAANIPEKRILIIMPFTQDNPGGQLYIQGIKSQLKKDSQFKFIYTYEYLDLANHSHDDEYLKDTEKYLKLKYSKFKPDIIVTAVNVYSLFSKYGNDMFPNVPVIIDWDEDKQPVKPMPSNYTIISEFTEIGQNIQVILQTKPKTKKSI